MATNLLLLAFGAFIGHLGPRLPVLIMTRGKGFNLRFEPHPEPMALTPHLTQRVLHMRTFYWSALLIALLLMAFGGASLRWGSAPFGFGLWLAASWLVLSRLQGALGGGRPAPWTLEMAEELQKAMNASTGQGRCCVGPDPHWYHDGIVCRSCGTLHASMARPDLGRKRTDGRMMGWVRLLITDGYPLTTAAPVADRKELPQEGVEQGNL